MLFSFGVQYTVREWKRVIVGGGGGVGGLVFTDFNLNSREFPFKD